MSEIIAIGGSVSDYMSGYEQRLSAHDLEPNQPYKLMMRSHAGAGFESFLTEASVRSVRSIGATSGRLIELLLHDSEGRPAYAVDSAMYPDDIWTPERPPLNLQYPIVESRMARIAVHEGFMLPADIGLDVNEMFGGRRLEITDDPGLHSHNPITGRSVA